MGRLARTTCQGSAPAAHTPLCLWSFASSSARGTKSATAGAFGFLFPLVISCLSCHSCHCFALPLTPAPWLLLPPPSRPPQWDAVLPLPASLPHCLASLARKGTRTGICLSRGGSAPHRDPLSPEHAHRLGPVLLRGHPVPCMGNAEGEPQPLASVQLDVSTCLHSLDHHVPQGCLQHSPSVSGTGQAKEHKALQTQQTINELEPQWVESQPWTSCS